MEDKKSVKVAKMSSSAVHMQDDSVHHESTSSTTVDKKTVSSKQTSLVNTEDDNTFTKPLRDKATPETRQSLSSKAKQQKQAMRENSADKRKQLADTNCLPVKQNATVSSDHW